MATLRVTYKSGSYDECEFDAYDAPSRRTDSGYRSAAPWLVLDQLVDGEMVPQSRLIVFREARGPSGGRVSGGYGRRVLQSSADVASIDVAVDRLIEVQGAVARSATGGRAGRQTVKLSLEGASAVAVV